eukprot:g4969.t1
MPQTSRPTTASSVLSDRAKATGIPPSVQKKQAEAKRREAITNPNINFDDPDDEADRRRNRILKKKNDLKTRIAVRKKERDATGRIVRADAKALIAAVRKEGRLLNPKKTMQREIRLQRVVKENGIILLAVANNGAMTRTLNACSDQQLKVEKALLLNKGIAKPHIKDRLPVAITLHDRVHRMKEMIQPKKRTTRMSGAARVNQELDFNVEPLAKPCIICGELVVPSLMKVHLELCQVRNRHRQRGGGGGLLTAEAEAKEKEAEAKRLAELKKKRAKKSKALMEVCRNCGRRVMANRLKKHMAQCAIFSKFAVQRNAELAASQGFDAATGCSVPEAPTNLHAEPLDPMTIRLSWKAPVYNGGMDIFDYLVSYQIRQEHKLGKKTWHTFSEEIQFRATRCCAVAVQGRRDFPPVGQHQALAHHGYTLHHLNAATTYGNFRVHAINPVGMGEGSDPFPLCRTPDACAPYPPLHVTIGKVTSHSIRVHWVPPMLTGGVPLKRYEVKYTRFGWKDLKSGSNDLVTNGEAGGKRWYEQTQTCSARNNSMTLQKLEGGLEYRNISVVAINAVNLSSGRSPTIESVFTKEPDKAQIIRDELRRARKFKHEYIDTEFMLDFPQRFSREEYVRYLLKKLEEIGENELPSDSDSEDSGSDEDLLLTPEQIKAKSERQAAKLKLEEERREAKKKADAAKDAIWKEKKAGYERSRRQFEFKINAIKDEIQKADETTNQLLSRRSQLASLCKYNYERLAAFNGERERVENTVSDWVDTMVLHGQPQRFRKDRLKEVLQEYTTKSRQDIAVAKFEINQIERDLKKWADHKERNEKRLQERLAAQYSFEKEAQRVIATRKRMMKVGKSVLHNIFKRWVKFVELALDDRRFLRTIIQRAMQGRLLAGFNCWKESASELGELRNQANAVSGIGSVLLLSKKVERTELCDEVQDALNLTAGVKARMDNLNRTEAQIKFQKTSVFFNQSENQRTIGAVFPELIEKKEKKKDRGFADNRDKGFKGEDGFDSRDESDSDEDKVIAPIDPLAQGDGYLKMGHTEKAIVMFERYLKKAKIAKDVVGMGLAFGRIGQCYQADGEYARALISHERHLQIARECDHVEGKAVALLGLAWAVHGQGSYRQSNDLCYKSIDLWHLLRDQHSQSKAYRLLSLNYGKMREHDKEEEMLRNAERVERELIVKVQNGITSTTAMIDRIVGVAASNKEIIPFQNCTASLPIMKRKQARMQQRLDEIDSEIAKHNRKIPRLEERLEMCEKQLSDAESQHGVGKLDSDFLHDDLKQRFTIGQLKTKLALEIKTHKEKLTLHREAIESLDVVKRNLKDEKNDVDNYVRVEGGELMLKVINSQTLLRCIAFNKSNLESMDVTGTSTGGIELVACAINKSIRVYDLHKGECCNIFGGDEEGSHVGEYTGHTKMITALLFHEEVIFSGSVDATVRVWYADEEECHATLVGHRASVWSIFADSMKIVTGSADCDVRIWSRRNFACLKVCRAHRKTVTYVAATQKAMMSASQDGKLIEWSIGYSEKKPVGRVKVDKRFVGHGAPVTCFQWSATELVSGDQKGLIIVWDTQDQLLLRRCEGHTSQVNCLQFDTSKIISGSRTADVMIHDISTGILLITLRGHTKSVTSLQFDMDMLLTGSIDGTMIRWPFKGSTKNKKDRKVKYEICKSGDTLTSIAKKAKISVDQFKFWNGFTDSQDLWIGARVIVMVEDSHGKVLVNDKPKNVHNTKRDPEEEQRLRELAEEEGLTASEKRALRLERERQKKFGKSPKKKRKKLKRPGDSTEDTAVEKEEKPKRIIAGYDDEGNAQYRDVRKVVGPLTGPSHMSSIILFFSFLATVFAEQPIGLRGSDPSFDHQTKTYKSHFKPVEVTGELDLTPFFSPDHSLDFETSLIGSAKKTLDVGTPGVSSWSECTSYGDKCQGCEVQKASEEKFPVFQALLNAIHRGVHVRILTNDYNATVCDGKVDPLTFLALAGAEITYYHSTTFMHAKYLQVDSEKASVSSVNWTRNSFTNDREAGLLIGGEDAAPALQFLTKVFESDLANGKPYKPDAEALGLTANDLTIIRNKAVRTVPKQKKHGLEERHYRSPMPVSIASSGSSLTMYTSPDYSLKTLQAQLSRVKKSLKLYVYQITSLDLCDTLIDMKKRGVKITILVSKSIYGQADQDFAANIYKKLNDAGIIIHTAYQYNSYMYSHQKVWIIDDEELGLSTGNWSPSDFPDSSTFPTHKSGKSWKSTNRDFDIIFRGNDKRVLKHVVQNRLILQIPRTHSPFVSTPRRHPTFCSPSFSTINHNDVKDGEKMKNDTEDEKKSSAGGGGARLLDPSSWPWGFIIGVSVVGGVVRWFYRNSQERKREERVIDDLESERSLAPSEVTKLKKLNDFTPNEFDRIVDASLKEFGNSRRKITSECFFSFVMKEFKSVFPDGIHGGHYLERLLFVVEQLEKPAGYSPKQVNQLSAMGSATTQLDIKLLLTILSLVVQGSAERRLESLFKLAATPYQDKDDENATLVSKEEEEEEIVRFVEAPAMKELLSFLVRTHQIPANFLTKELPTEPGTYFGMRRFGSANSDLILSRADAKLAEEAPDLHAKHNPLYKTEQPHWMLDYLPSILYKKPIPEPLPRYDLEQFVELMLYKPVCIWGECYKKRRKYLNADEIKEGEVGASINLKDHRENIKDK